MRLCFLFFFILSFGACSPNSSSQLLGEEKLFGELDLYDHPTNLEPKYHETRFAPVRRYRAKYFFRKPNKSFAVQPRAGKFMGEIELDGEKSSLVYLPQVISSKGLQGLKISLLRASSGGKIGVRIYLKKNQYYEFLEGSDFKVLDRAKWEDLSLSLSGKEFKKSKLNKPHTENLEFLEADNLLVAVEIFASEGSGKQNIFFDEMSALKKSANGKKVVGRTAPRRSGVKIAVRTSAGQLIETKSNFFGTFEVDLPEETEAYEVVARRGGSYFLPRQGRYFEVGSVLTPLEIPIRTDFIDREDFKKPARNVGLKMTTSKTLSNTYEPLAYSFYTKKDKDFEFMIENSMNEFGYPDKDRRFENKDDAFRVVIMGGCHESGIMVGDAEKAAVQAEVINRFSGEIPNLEVINVSHQYQTLSQFWPILKDHALKYKPDVVIVNYLQGDQFRHTSLVENSSYYGYDPKHPRNYHFELGPAGRLIHRPHDPGWRSRVKGDRKREDFYWNFAALRVDQSSNPEIYGITLKTLEKAFREFSRVAKKEKVEIILSHGSDMNGVTKTDRFKRDGFDHDPKLVDSLISGIAGRSGLKFENMQSRFRHYFKDNSGVESFRYRFDKHWAPLAHRAFAEEIVSIATKYYRASQKSVSEIH